MAQRISTIWSVLPEAVRDTMTQYQHHCADKHIRALWYYEKHLAYVEDKVTQLEQANADYRNRIASALQTIEQLESFIKEQGERE